MTGLHEPHVLPASSLEDDERFPRFAVFRPNDAHLIGSGLLPVFPLLDGKLIWGRHLVDAVLTAFGGDSPVVCREVTTDPVIAFLGLESRTGQYSWTEKAEIFALWEFFGSRDAALFSRLVTGDEGFPAQMEKYRQLNPAERELVDRVLVDIKTLFQHRNVPAPLADLFSRYAGGWTVSRRRMVWKLLFEIASAQRHAVEELSVICARALEETDPQAALEAIRMPDYSALKEKFDTVHETLFHGTGIRVSPPASFEGDELTVNFRVNSVTGLKRKLGALEKWAREGGLFDSLG